MSHLFRYVDQKVARPCIFDVQGAWVAKTVLPMAGCVKHQCTRWQRQLRSFGRSFAAVEGILSILAAVCASHSQDTSCQTTPRLQHLASEMACRLAFSAQAKAADVVDKLSSMKLNKAAELVEQAIDETLSFYAYPPQHWIKLKTNNPMERLLKEARRRTKVVGAFPDGHSALMLVAARLRHVSATTWGTRKFMNMRLLEEMDRESVYCAA